MEKLYAPLTLAFVALAAIGIWVIAAQNAGFIKSRVGNAPSIDFPRTMEVSGTVDIDNTVDINIQKVNGYSYFYDSNSEPGKYHRLPVYGGY